MMSSLARKPQLHAGAALLGLIVMSVGMGRGESLASPPTSPSGNTVQVDAVKKAVERKLGEAVVGIARLTAAGLYEMRVGNNVVYTDASGRYLILGDLIDLRTNKNITRMRIDDIKQASLPRFRFSDLPFTEAVKIVKGSGKREVAIFEDPNCGYCKKLEKSILDIGDVTIYVFMYPVLGSDSLAKSKQVWCATDRSRAWTGWMQGSTTLTGNGQCATPLDRNLILGRNLKVDGTPTMFFSNNKRVEGSVDAHDLERLLAG